MELEIKWQRLVKDGETCERCSGTEEEVENAVERLEKGLEEQEVEVILEKSELDMKEFKEQPEKSNRIFIDGKPLEQLVDAEEGTSKCCDFCGERDCRTVEKDGETYETVPEKLIVEAGLRAVLDQKKSCGCGCGSC